MKETIALIVALFSAAPLPHGENASATRLLATVERFGDDFACVRRGQVPSGFLEKHGNTIRTLRAAIISNEPPVWALDAGDAQHPPLPPLRVNVRLFAILAADARAQTSNAAAWADLHAIWILSRSLLERPESSSIRAGLFGRRIIDDVDLPGPKPAWWSDYASFDVKLPLVRSRAYATWQAVEEMFTK